MVVQLHSSPATRARQLHSPAGRRRTRAAAAPWRAPLRRRPGCLPGTAEALFGSSGAVAEEEGGKGTGELPRVDGEALAIEALKKRVRELEER